MFLPVSTESLEPRRLFSAAFINHGTLNIRGDAKAGSAVIVDNSADGQSLDVTIDWTTARGVVKHFDASFAKTLPFTSIRILGGKGDDTIDIGQHNGAVSLNARIDGRQGNDTINTSDGNDLIVGGKGADIVNSGNGDDEVHGGKDIDIITGGEGNDVLWGGGDDDQITGGNGDDTLGGVIGINSLHGNAGRDTFRTAGLANNTDNDYDAATDVLVIVPPKADADSAKV